MRSRKKEDIIPGRDEDPTPDDLASSFQQEDTGGNTTLRRGGTGTSPVHYHSGYKAHAKASVALKSLEVVVAMIKDKLNNDLVHSCSFELCLRMRLSNLNPLYVPPFSLLLVFKIAA